MISNFKIILILIKLLALSEKLQGFIYVTKSKVTTKKVKEKLSMCKIYSLLINLKI